MKLLRLLALIFLLLFIIYSGYNWYQGYTAEKNAEKLLESYNEEIMTEVSTEKEMSSTESTTTTVSEDNVDDIYLYSKDYVIGKISIPAIDINMPIIKETTNDYLKISVCRYGTTEIGAKGNLVICGHNYRNGAHFGNLNKLKINDIIKISDKNGNEYCYEVYETEMILPTEVAKVKQYVGDRGLTLFTCNDKGDKRFVVRCKEKKI